jgi:hypothetical protein
MFYFEIILQMQNLIICLREFSFHNKTSSERRNALLIIDLSQNLLSWLFLTCHHNMSLHWSPRQSWEMTNRRTEGSDTKGRRTSHVAVFMMHPVQRVTTVEQMATIRSTSPLPPITFIF